MRSASSRRLQVERRQRGRAKSNSGGGRGGAKGKSSVEPSFCTGCNFSLKYDGPSGVQITNGQILNSDQIANAPDDIAICDDCKCAATNSQVIIMDVEGECDLFFGIDVLEFTVTATEETGDVDVVCPDVTYFATAACEAYDMLAGGAMRTPQVPPTFQIIVEGPNAMIQHQAETYLDCTVVCSNPSPPDLSVGKSGKSKGKSRFPPQSEEDLSSSLKREVLKVYEPFADKFPI